MRFDLAIVVLAQAWAFNVHATPVTTIDWGLCDPIEAALSRPKGNVDDFVLFAVKDATGVLSSAESKEIGAGNGRKGGTVYLFQDIGDVLVGSYEFGGGTGGIGHEFDLQPGNHYYQIVNKGAGASGGAYTFSSPLRGEAAVVEAGPFQVNDVSEPQKPCTFAGRAGSAWLVHEGAQALTPRPYICIPRPGAIARL